jgi:hypothetical protein
MTLFGEPQPHPMVEEFEKLELDALSPKEALEWLYRMQRMLLEETGKDRTE